VGRAGPRARIGQRPLSLPPYPGWSPGQQPGAAVRAAAHGRSGALTGREPLPAAASATYKAAGVMRRRVRSAGPAPRAPTPAAAPLPAGACRRRSEWRRSCAPRDLRHSWPAAQRQCAFFPANPLSRAANPPTPGTTTAASLRSALRRTGAGSSTWTRPSASLRSRCAGFAGMWPPCCEQRRGFAF
jgi:hypothetical protein